jgi:hypothetical protein
MILVLLFAACGALGLTLIFLALVFTGAIAEVYLSLWPLVALVGAGIGLAGLVFLNRS